MSTPLVQDEDFRLGPANLWVYTKPKASLETGVSGAFAALVKQELTITATQRGVAGNAISLTLVDPSGNDSPLSLSLEGTAITVNLETGPGGALISTVEEVAALLNQLDFIAATYDPGDAEEVLEDAVLDNLEGGLDADDPDAELIFRARRAGVAGNAIQIAYVDPPGNNVPLSVAVVGTVITVTLETDGASAIVSTAAEVRDAIAAHPGAKALVYGVFASGGDGTGVVAAMGATNLTGGSDTETERFLGALTEETVVRTSVTASVMTAHTTGTQPRDKVTSGGTFQISAGLKELTLQNFELGFPNASLIEGADGKRRLEFRTRAGESLRQARGVKMQLRRLLSADEETADPHEILTIPICSPVDGDVELLYNVTDQRFLPVNFEAWPDATGLTAYFGYGPGEI